MAFTQESFAPISSHGNSDSPNIYTYTTPDNSAEILAEDYFTPKFSTLNDGDLILVKASDVPVLGQFNQTPDGFTIERLVGGGSVTGNSVVITKTEDFELFDDDTVFLTDGFEYCIRGDVDISPRRLIGVKAQFCGSGLNRSILRSDVDGGAFINTTGSLFTKDLTFQTDGTAEMLDCTGTALMNFRDTVFAGDRGGEINLTGFSAIIIRFCSMETDISALRIGGDMVRIDLDQFFPTDTDIDPSATFIDFLTGLTISDRITITKCLMDIGASGIGYNFQDLTGFPNEGVQFMDCTFTGAGTPVVGLLPSDNEAFFAGNLGLISSFPNAAWLVGTNVLFTTIATIGVPVVINTDNITLGSNTQRFSLSTVTLTYTGARARAFQINAVLVLETSQNNQRIGAEIFVNGNPTGIAFTTITSGSAGTRIENMSLAGSFGFASGATIDLRVFNLTSTDNIRVADAILQLAAIN